MKAIKKVLMQWVVPEAQYPPVSREEEQDQEIRLTDHKMRQWLGYERS